MKNHNITPYFVAHSVICPSTMLPSNTTMVTAPLTTTHRTWFQDTWSQTRVAPFVLLPVLYPLVSFKSATFFTKFNALGLCFNYIMHSLLLIHLVFIVKTLPYFLITKNCFMTCITI